MNFVLVSYNKSPHTKVSVCESMHAGDVELKEWKCVDVARHKEIPETVEEYQEKGWHLHSYAAAGSPTITTHYLLFEREP